MIGPIDPLMSAMATKLRQYTIDRVNLFCCVLVFDTSSLGAISKVSDKDAVS
jgi:hypothetical protein